MSKVVKAVKKVFKKVGKVAKSIFKSKIFKTLIIAAAIYFGGAGLASWSSGKGFMAGVEGAWTSLGNAGSSLLKGNFGEAGTSLAEPFASTATNTAPVTSAPNAVVGEFQARGARSAAMDAAIRGDVLAKPGLLKQAPQALSYGDGIVKGAKIAAGTQVVGSAINAYGNYKVQKDAEEREDFLRRRRAFFGQDQLGNSADVSGGLKDIGVQSMYDVGLLRPKSSTPRNLDDLLG